MSLMLAFESSCDETACAVVEDGRLVRSNVIATQHDLHARYGGVVPELASRAHLERLVPVMESALAEAGASLEDIDAVCAGVRPGLIGSLLVGTTAAKTIAWSIGVPFLAVDHVEAHLLAGLLERDDVRWPAVGLVVSGGHTSLYEMAGPLDLVRLGATIDDAAGEAFDKAATMLGLGYPGGPALDELAERGDDRAHDLPIALPERERLDFSFSGLKTAVLYAIRGAPKRIDGTVTWPRSLDALDDGARADLAASFRRAVVTALLRKTTRALERTGARTLLVGGGVSANRLLRHELAALAEERDLDVRLPAMAYCLDNAAMLAVPAHHRFIAGERDALDVVPEPSSRR